MKLTGFNSETYVAKLAKVTLIADDLKVEEKSAQATLNYL